MLLLTPAACEREGNERTKASGIICSSISFKKLCISSAWLTNWLTRAGQSGAAATAATAALTSQRLPGGGEAGLSERASRPQRTWQLGSPPSPPRPERTPICDQPSSASLPLPLLHALTKHRRPSTGWCRMCSRLLCRSWVRSITRISNAPRGHGRRPYGTVQAASPHATPPPSLPWQQCLRRTA